MAGHSIKHSNDNLYCRKRMEGFGMTAKETADYIESSLIEAGISLEGYLNWIEIWQGAGHEIRDELRWRVEQRQLRQRREN